MRGRWWHQHRNSPGRTHTRESRGKEKQDASNKQRIEPVAAMASLTRRNVNTVQSGEGKQRSSSLWEQEADHYWKEMEPAKKYKKISGYVGFVVIGLLVISGAAWSAKSVWNNPSLANFSTLKNRFFPLPAVNLSTASAPTTNVEPVSAVSSTPQQAPATGSSPAPRTSDPAAVDLLRARCRVRGVQTRWHEETCRKLCIRDPQNAACMNGCSYGSITITKATCDHLDIASIPTTQQCPDGVNCVVACKAYENEAPAPATRVSCERACTNIVASSCSRILQIYRDLYKGSM